MRLVDKKTTKSVPQTNTLTKGAGRSEIVSFMKKRQQLVAWGKKNNKKQLTKKEQCSRLTTRMQGRRLLVLWTYNDLTLERGIQRV